MTQWFEHCPITSSHADAPISKSFILLLRRIHVEASDEILLKEAIIRQELFKLHRIYQLYVRKKIVQYLSGIPGTALGF